MLSINVRKTIKIKKYSKFIVYERGQGLGRVIVVKFNTDYFNMIVMIKIKRDSVFKVISPCPGRRADKCVIIFQKKKNPRYWQQWGSNVYYTNPHFSLHSQSVKTVGKKTGAY